MHEIRQLGQKFAQVRGREQAIRVARKIKRAAIGLRDRHVPLHAQSVSEFNGAIPDKDKVYVQANAYQYGFMDKGAFIPTEDCIGLHAEGFTESGRKVVLNQDICCFEGGTLASFDYGERQDLQTFHTKRVLDDIVVPLEVSKDRGTVVYDGAWGRVEGQGRENMRRQTSSAPDVCREWDPAEKRRGRSTRRSLTNTYEVSATNLRD